MNRPLPLTARLAARELRGGLRAFRVFLACLALGVAAIAAVGTVRQSIEAGLSREGATLLGGDAEMRFTYRHASADELAWMKAHATAVSEVVDFRSMAVTTGPNGTDRALTQVKAVDGAYPLKGKVGLTPAMPLAEALAPHDGLPGAVIQKPLADRLGLRPGDTFSLGTQSFHLSAILTNEPDSSSAGFSLGPRTIVYTRDLAQSGLLAPGTLYETHYRLDLPPGTDLAKLEAQATAKFADKGMRWRDKRKGSPRVQEFVDRIGSFLVIVGLAGMAVGGVGVSAAVRAYLGGKVTTIATLKTIGADRTTIFLTYLWQVAAITAVSLVAGLVLGAAIPLAAAPFVTPLLPVPVEIGVYPGPLAEAALYGVLTAFLFALWPVARTEEVRAAALFRDAVGRARVLPRRRYIAATALLFVALVGAATWFSGLVRLTLWSAAGIVFALALLAGVAWGVRLIARRLAAMRAFRGRTALRLALGAVGGPGEEATSVILSLGLGLSVLAAVGQIDTNLRHAIETNLPAAAPSYFFIDIQDSELAGFKQKLAADKGVHRVETAPMLRGVITKINGLPAKQVAGDHWVVRGDRGISFEASPPKGTQITAGKWWPKDYSGPPQVSFSAQEAEEIGLKLGDTITLNILGRDIKATITSFRSVDFSTAGMGFVMVVDPAAVAGAPHSSIATVYADAASEGPVLREIAQAYPNITAISVREAIDNVARILNGIGAATTAGAGITLLTGFIVLIGAAAAGERARIFEAAVLKTLGGTRARILVSFALRSVILGGAAGLVAIFTGIGAGWAIMHFVMNGTFAVNWGSALAIVLGGIAVTVLAGMVFAWGPLSARPARVLRARD